jgi:HD-GYP domain-containing protein (c-di-GMP phosphodiesterase class II)
MITEGLFVSKNKRVISQINQNSYTMSLLATGGNVDIVIYDIRVDKPCNIAPGENPGLMEFFYVLEGAVILKLDDGEIVLEKGEYFHVYNLKCIINFTTSNGAKLLGVSSQPMFKHLMEYQEGLCKLLDSVEAKDMYTYNHGYRVQMYSVKIGERLMLAQDKIYTLQVASLFHDIGKYYVPDSILKKPDKLTDDEYECIKKHSADSSHLLKGKFEENILQAVEQHHERLDGSGYPGGLVNEQIMIEAKIIAVADTYDAITSERAYRRALSPELALRELERLDGKQYDAAVVQALREVLQEEGALPDTSAAV